MAVRIADSLRVIRDGAGGTPRLEINGELFEWATVDSFAVHPKRGQLPGVTLTITAYRVEVVDDIGTPAVEVPDVPR